MNDDVLKLENQLCFPLYACARKVVNQYKPLLDKIHLTYTQYIVMLVLWETDEITVKQLGQRLYLDSGTLTPLLKRLQKDGLITRTRSAEDERSVIITLTEKAVDLQQEAKNIPAQMKTCLQISSKDSATLYRILYQMLDDDIESE